VELTFARQMVVVQMLFPQRTFNAVSLSLGQLLLSIGRCTIVFIAVELVQLVRQQMR